MTAPLRERAGEANRVRLGPALLCAAAAVVLILAAGEIGDVGPLDRAKLQAAALLPGLLLPGALAIGLRPLRPRLRGAVHVGLAAMVALAIGVPLWVDTAARCAASSMPFSPRDAIFAALGCGVGVWVALRLGDLGRSHRAALGYGTLGALLGGGIAVAAIIAALAPPAECIVRPSV